MILDLLSPGLGTQKESEARGGILRNFDLTNINASLAQDQHLQVL